MASFPDEFNPPEYLDDSLDKGSDEEEASTDPESVNSGSDDDGANSTAGDGFQPSDDSSANGQDNEDEEESEGGDEEIEDLDIAEENLGSDGDEEGGEDEVESVESGGNGLGDDVEDDVEGEEEELPLAPNQAFLNQGNVGDIDGGLAALQGNGEAPNGGNGGENGQDDDEDDDGRLEPHADILLPDEQLQLLGITQEQFMTFPIADGINIEIVVALCVSLLRMSTRMGFHTFPMLSREMDNNTQWIAWTAGEVSRYFAASHLRLDALGLELYVQAVFGGVENLATGLPAMVNLRATMLAAGECTEPMPARLRDAVINAQGVNNNNNGG